MRNKETGLDYSAVDLQEVRIRQSTYRHKRDWKDDYLDLLKSGDLESAHELRMRNDEKYREEKEAEAASVFPKESPQLQSLQHAEIERVEIEAA